MKKLFFLLFIAISSVSANYSWTPTVHISDPTAEPDAVSVALDPNGNAVAVWRALVGPDRVIQAATKLFGQPWSAPETISPLGELVASPPLVKVDPLGNAVVVWITQFGGLSIRSANKLFGMPWSAADLVTGSSSTDKFDFVMAPNGNVTLIWQITPANMVLASERTLLGAWSAVPTTLSAVAAFSPRVGIDASGNVTGTWQDSQNIVFARKPFGSLVWGPTLTAFGLGGAFSPMISVNLAGDAIIIWAGNAGVAAAYVPFNQVADPAQTISAASTGAFSQPNIGLDNNGNAIATWFDSSTGANLSSTKLFGQSWSAPSLLTFPGFQKTAFINVNSCNLALISFLSTQGTTVTSGFIGSSFSAPFSLSNDGIAAIDQNPCGHAMAVFLELAVGAREGIFFFNVDSFSGFQKKNNFGTLSEYENHLRWSTSTQNVAGFRIYRNGSLIAFVKGNKNTYIDPDRLKNVPVVYEIATVDSQGAETSHMTTIVP